MRSININKVIREINDIIYAEFPNTVRVKGVDFINCNKVIQIIKDNIQEVEDNKIDKLIDRADKIFEYLEPQITILPSDAIKNLEVLKYL